MTLSIASDLVEAWDFRVSLVGKVLGVTLATGGSATRDSNGVQANHSDDTLSVNAPAGLKLAGGPVTLVYRLTRDGAPTGGRWIGQAHNNGVADPYVAYATYATGANLRLAVNDGGTYRESGNIETSLAAGGPFIYIAEFVDDACKIYKDNSQQGSTYVASIASGFTYHASNNLFGLVQETSGNPHITNWTHLAVFKNVLSSGDRAAIQSNPDEIFPAAGGGFKAAFARGSNQVISI